MPSRSATTVNLYLNGQKNPKGFRPLRCTRVLGGAQLDTAEIMIDLAQLGQRVENCGILPPNSQVVIELLTVAGAQAAPVSRVIHWGKATLQHTLLGEGQERRRLVSRVEPYHFGDVIRGQWQRHPAGRVPVLVDVDIVFNPRIDGVALGNRSAIQGATPRGDKYFWFVDPESVRTAAAASLEGTTGQWWTLSQAVTHLCCALNPAERYFQNPRHIEWVDDALYGDTWLEDVRLRRGLDLPRALTELLEPLGFGFTWSLDLVGSRQIEIFRRGRPRYGTFPLQAPLAALGAPIGKSAVALLDVDANVGNCRNVVTVSGDWIEVESTFELYRAWAVGDDGRDPDKDLALDCDNYKNTPSYARVWRDWVLNEAGDYGGLRPEIPEFRDLSVVYNVALLSADEVLIDPQPVIPKRRRFLPCLTQGADLAPIGDLQGIEVEYSVSGPAGPWLPLKQLADHTCHVLERECGIRFDGRHVPIELYQAGEQACVRVTATIRFDRRLAWTANDNDTSPLNETAAALIDLADRYHFRRRGASSKYWKPFPEPLLPAATADDSASVREYAEGLVNAWNMADVDGKVKIEGLDRFFCVPADCLSKIVGREIALNANLGLGVPGDNQPDAFPQVARIDYELLDGRQGMTLTLSTYRDTLPAKQRDRSDQGF